MTKIERTCPRCGLVFFSEHLDDLCPGCLISHSLDDVEPSTSSAFWEDPPNEDVPPSTRSFSHFEILEEIGRGGMGVVYRARDHSTARIVALKVLQAHHLEVPDLVQRFRSEVRAVTSLDHPHVLPIHEVGEHDGIPFFSMKLTTGGSLAQRLGDFLSKPKEAAQLLAKIARGVQHAHERGILHRDLKPGNILIDAAGEPYVADFGLAKWLEEDRHLTVTAAVLGTPHYIAPEQASGTKALTTAVDIYSLGAILYELLTGRPPFVGGTVIETLRQASEKTPDRPSSLVHNVPHDLETICLKCIEREPASRYASAALLADDLEAWLTGRAIHARPVNAAGQLWRWAKRNPLPATLVASLVLTLVAATVVSTLSAIRVRSALYNSLLAQAKASRSTGRASQRYEALEAIQQAAKINPSLELRNEAAVSLALDDFKIEQQWSIGPNGRTTRAFDASLNFVAEEYDPGVVRVVRLTDGATIARLDEGSNLQRARAEYIQWSSSGLIAVRHSGGKLKIWNSDGGKLLYQLNIPILQRAPWFAPNFGFNSSGTVLANAGESGGVVICDAKTGDKISFLSTNGIVRCLSFSNDGKYIALSENDGRILYLFDISEKKLLKSIELISPAYSIAWSPDNLELAVGSFDFNIYLYKVQTGQRFGSFTGHRQEVTQVLFNQSGDRLVSTGRDNSVRLWSLDSLSQEVVLTDCGGEPAMRFSADGTKLAVTNSERKACVLSLARPEAICKTMVNGRPAGRATLVGSVAFSADGLRIATSCWESIDVWDVESGRLISSLDIDVNEEKSVRFGATSSSLLVGSRKSGLNEYELTSDRGTVKVNLIRTLDPEPGFIFSNSPPGDRELIGLTSRDRGIAKIFDLKSGRDIFRVEDQLNAWDLALSPDLKWFTLSFSSISPNSKTQIWSFPDRRLVMKLPAGQNGTARFSPDGKWLKATGGDVMNYVWNTHSWSPNPEINFEGIHHAFDPQSRWIAGVSSNKRDCILIMDPSGKILLSLQSPLLPGSDYRLASSPDGNLLAAQSADNTLLVWNLKQLWTELSRIDQRWSSPFIH